jgi:hypothetical protein
MQAGNFKILYFDNVKDCFRTYELIGLKWEFPFEINDGYAIVYKPKLDTILDIENYEIRWVINNPFTQIK